MATVFEYGSATIQADRVESGAGEIRVYTTLSRMRHGEAIVALGSELQSHESKRLVCWAGTFDAMPLSWETRDDPTTNVVHIQARFSVQKANDAHPYRSLAPREEEPLPRMTGKALTETARRYGLDRKLGEGDDALWERMKARMTPLGAGTILPSAYAEVMQEADELRARAGMLGVELDPGETIQGLRERVEAYLAGDERAADPKAWQERTRRSTRAGATPEEAIASLEKSISRMHEVCKPVTFKITARPSPEAIRAENRRIGEEIAANPPEWAYPLAWRLAVMAAIEQRNAESNPPPMSPQHLAAIGEWLRIYHAARLDGCLSERATEIAISDMPSVGEYIALLCQAYERGRPGPGGVR